MSSIKFFSCTGLCGDKYKAYIECTQLTATHGGAPPCHELARQLFPLVFSIGLKIKYSKLKSDQLEHLEQELVNQSKWWIQGLSIRSTKCEKDTEHTSKICIECQDLNNDQVFKVLYL